jgi:glucose-6-phosphate 1-dehydrogenase
MPTQALVQRSVGEPIRGNVPPGEPCILVLFGASGDLTKRLLMPALYNLACDRLLPEPFALVGISLEEMSTEAFRSRMSEDIRQFNTRPTFDAGLWDQLVRKLYYTPGNFGDAEAYARLVGLIARAQREQHLGGNLLFYLATPPAVFGLVAGQLAKAGLAHRDQGWSRLVIEKPFGHDLNSAISLNQELLAHWSEEQIYRIDHYLGKETVQNLLAFRFANGIFEPVWNKTHVDHIQMTVSETVGVEGRGNYYDRTGVLRDMIQNHMLQMLAYVMMEPPASFRADAIRNEKAKLLGAIRLLKPEEVRHHAVRGQYGPGRKPDGTAVPGYRQEPNVNPQSCTETFAALRLFVDNWRWEGVPVYLRSGKALWKRGTEIVIQFKRAPEVIFRDTPAVGRLESNRLLFHIQPDQGIELRFHAKSPGPAMALQKVNMRFDYREAFEAARGTGYEVLLYNAMIGDATLFSRSDLVETSWRIAQPVLDAWAAEPAPSFPNYPAGSWGPKAAFELLQQDGRRWIEVINRSVLEKVPLFQCGDPVFLQNLAMMLRSSVAEAGDVIIRKGDPGAEMYFLCRGRAEVQDAAGKVLNSLGEGDFFGEMALLSDQPRAATVRAVEPCDLFVLDKSDFTRLVKERPELIGLLRDNAKKRYQLEEVSW